MSKHNRTQMDEQTWCDAMDLRFAKTCHTCEHVYDDDGEAWKCEKKRATTGNPQVFGGNVCELHKESK
jgi:hypothetical protein